MEQDTELVPGVPTEVLLDEGRRETVKTGGHWVGAERIKEAPATDPKQYLLLKTQLRPAPVKLAGNAPVSREVRQVIAVQQVKVHPTDLDLPGAQPDRGITSE